MNSVFLFRLLPDAGLPPILSTSFVRESERLGPDQKGSVTLRRVIVVLPNAIQKYGMR